MRSLTEQVTFKVSRETLIALQERGRSHGLDANPFARKLVEEGLERDRTENLSDEFRELLAELRPLAQQLSAQPLSSNHSPSTPPDSSQLRHLAEAISGAISRIEENLFRYHTEFVDQLRTVATPNDQLMELRSDLNKTFAALLHYQMGFSADDAQQWVNMRLNSTQR